LFANPGFAGMQHSSRFKKFSKMAEGSREASLPASHIIGHGESRGFEYVYF
jgi:hypothetical protein